MKFIKNYIEDILIILGAGAIITATFLLSFIVGLYVLGGALFAAGVWLAKHPMR